LGKLKKITFTTDLKFEIRIKSAFFTMTEFLEKKNCLPFLALFGTSEKHFCKFVADSSLHPYPRHHFPFS
jgi:hypothetical protein